MNTKASGDTGEQRAVEYLAAKGYKILERNAVYGGSEVDVIALHKLRKGLFKSVDAIVFCEVKTREGFDFGTPSEAVTPYKIGRYVTAAKAYAQSRDISGLDIRFDVICVSPESVEHIENAFSSSDAKYPRRG